MDRTMLCGLAIYMTLFVVADGRIHQLKNDKISLASKPHDAIGKSVSRPGQSVWGREGEFKYKFLSQTGEVFNSPGEGLLEVAATIAVSDTAHDVGLTIVSAMTLNMPPQVFLELAAQASVGLFTEADHTTVFPEYEHLKDRPECEGTCEGNCSDTCTSDGRKWDDLAGVGGVRATCVDDNFMCTENDPYYHQFSVLVHEFGHTIHLYALPGSSDYYEKVEVAYRNAVAKEIWDVSSYAMANSMEYFAEGTGTFFNTNRHPTSSGGMNGCGKPSGQFCSSETEARDWLRSQDPMLFDALSFTFTNYQPSTPGGLSVCVV